MARSKIRLLAVLVPLLASCGGGKPIFRPTEESPSAAGEYQVLNDEYLNALKESNEKFDKTKTDEERQRIRADFHALRCKIVNRYLDFAETHPKDKEAVLALFFVLHPDTHAEDGDADRAVQLIRKDHIKSDRFDSVPILQVLADRDCPGREMLLRAVLEQNPHHTIQAQACLSLAQILKERADAGPAEEAAKLTSEAEECFERVVDKYADVKEAAQKARSELVEIRHLAIGRIAPDIEGADSDDKPFKLSDYRGRVVVLDFWAEW
jgi:hypothetical protein